jgi:Glycosyl transferase family 90
MTPHGTMIAVREHDQVRFLLPAIATPHVRIESTIPMFRHLLQETAIQAPCSPRLAARHVLVIQFDDAIHHDIGSVAFCRPRGEAPAVHLVPDTYFFLSRGYQWLRDVVASLPSWAERQNLVFWRGSATNNRIAIDGSAIEGIEQIPRVTLCLALRGHELADAAISACWGSDFVPEEQLEYFTKEQIFRPAIPMPEHGSYRYLIDIDGVASAWGFFEKLLLGSCVLKVGSRFEQWYYRELREWQHFVPVRADLGDLVAQIEWCHEHPDQARQIAEEGQRFALAHSFEVARQIALQAIRSRWLEAN